MQASDPSKRPSEGARPIQSEIQSLSQSFPSPPRSNPKASSLASIAVQSFAAFRSQTQQSPAPSPVRRKPLPVNSPVGRFTPVEYTNPSTTAVATERPNIQPSSSSDPPLSLSRLSRRLDTIPSPPGSDHDDDEDVYDLDLFVPRNLDENPHGATPTATAPKNPFGPRKSSLSYSTSAAPTTPRHDRSVSSVQPQRQSRAEELRAAANKGTHVRSPTMPNMPLYTTEPHQQQQQQQQQPPNLKLQLEGLTEDFIDEDPYDITDLTETTPESANPSKPKSPAARTNFGSFFGWTSRPQQNEVESPTTSFSESPGPSPRFPKRTTSTTSKSKPAGLDIPSANAFAQPSYFNVPGTPLLSSSPQMNAHVEELERELREVSSELAASIRRELDLEDEVERWKSESSSVIADTNRRTSDYYSDSGTSSVRFPIGDPEGKLEEVELLRRKAEQERAQLKVHMAERLQEELRRRRDLEEQVQQLEETVSSQPRSDSVGSPERVRELENSLDDAKRRLAEERQVKENFEDLLSALRDELEQHRNERDNLRDEVVPQLKARLDGLESEASNTQSLVYENTRMQQEVQQLRNENQTLVTARRMQQELSQQSTRFQSIAEESEGAPAEKPRVGLSRSNSLARSSAFNPKRGSLSRSNSVKNRSIPQSPSEELPTGNPIKELEEQRDALHKALKHLLKRQELQQRDFQKRIKELEAERDNLMNLTPRRTTFQKEVTSLRDEINSLRRRADDALEQKWQCEKGLGGLRMDLDRAQQETSSLRDLLQEHDITIPEIRIEGQPISLDKAYDELRTTHALSLARIREMESESADSLTDADHTLTLLKRSISSAEAERDTAQKEAEAYRAQARALQKSEVEHLGKEQKLSAELFAAATRMDDLSDRIQVQLQSNRALRSRLADAISRGEKEQEVSAEKIIELERRLKAAEDKVLLAQQSSEDAISRHEEEVKVLKESTNTHLRRANPGLLSPASLSPQVPGSPMFGQRSPRLDATSSGPAMSFAEVTKTQDLEKRVRELEGALADADREMQEVVGRMNGAQIEVADLQFARDEAMRQTRKLQQDIVVEREKVKVLMGGA